MAYRQKGLYKVKQLSGSKVVHYGIMDVGNCLRRLGGNYLEIAVIHQTPPEIRVEILHDFGSWKIVRPIRDEVGAIRRIKLALETPMYNLFGNNCEHFVNFVETGKRESPQLQGAVVLAGLAALVIVPPLLKRARLG